jgi:hypothetical protein
MHCFDYATNIHHIYHPFEHKLPEEVKGRNRALGIAIFIISGLMSAGIIPSLLLMTAYKKSRAFKQIKKLETNTSANTINSLYQHNQNSSNVTKTSQAQSNNPPLNQNGVNPASANMTSLNNSNNPPRGNSTRQPPTSPSVPSSSNQLISTSISQPCNPLISSDLTKGMGNDLSMIRKFTKDDMIAFIKQAEIQNKEFCQKFCDQIYTKLQPTDEVIINEHLKKLHAKFREYEANSFTPPKNNEEIVCDFYRIAWNPGDPAKVFTLTLYIQSVFLMGSNEWAIKLQPPKKGPEKPNDPLVREGDNRPQVQLPITIDCYRKLIEGFILNQFPKSILGMSNGRNFDIYPSSFLFIKGVEQDKEGIKNFPDTHSSMVTSDKKLVNIKTWL